MDENLIRTLFQALTNPAPQNSPDSPQAFMDARDIFPAIDPHVLGDLKRRYEILPPTDPHSQPGAAGVPQFTFGAHLPLAPLLQRLPQNAMFDILRALSPQLSFSAQTPNPWTPPEINAGFSMRRKW